MLFINIDILEKLGFTVLIIFLLILNFNIENVIDFITSTGQIFVLSFLSVIGGLFGTSLFIKISKKVMSDSKYSGSLELSIENSALILFFILLIWICISYYLFKISIIFMEKIVFMETKLMVLTSLHFKIIEAGTVLAGFMSLLVSVIITIEFNNIMNQIVLGFYLLCLIPFFYFHFHDEKYRTK